MKNKLKHLQSLVAVALCVIMSFALASCSDDDDESDNNPIVGTWLLTQQESDGEYWYCQYNFKSNGTFDVKDWSSDSSEPSDYEAQGKWATSNDMLTLVFDEDNESESYRFSISGNKLTIYDYEESGPNVFVKR